MGRNDPDLRCAMLAHLREHHPGMCRHWFDDIEPLGPIGGVLYLVVKELVQLRYLQRCCVEQFAEAARAATGHLLAVRFIGEEERDQIGRGASQQQRAETADAETFLPDDDMLISPDYSFQNFVVGPGNQLAHAAAVAVSKKPGRAYNPFFIHGGVGLGKTHLLQAICQSIIRDAPSTRLHYTTCNGFMTQFVEAVQAGQMSLFRQRFRSVDLLVIDDIHDLRKRDQSQEEFFHTFNSLYQAGKQIVISSDAPPNEIPDLEERLTSRFNCGLVARIEKPCFETRVAILKSKGSLRNLAISDDVASYVASKIDTNIRELEGAVTKMQGLSQINSAPINMDLAKLALGESTSPLNGSQQPTIQTILETVTSYYDVKLGDLLSKRRHKSIALPRQVGMWLARKYTRYSLEEIGGYFGGRDHTTVMHAIRTVDARKEEETGLKNDVTRLETRLIEV